MKYKLFFVRMISRKWFLLLMTDYLIKYYQDRYNPEVLALPGICQVVEEYLCTIFDRLYIMSSDNCEAFFPEMRDYADKLNIYTNGYWWPQEDIKSRLDFLKGLRKYIENNCQLINN